MNAFTSKPEAAHNRHEQMREPEKAKETEATKPLVIKKSKRESSPKKPQTKKKEKKAQRKEQEKLQNSGDKSKAE